MVSRRSFKNDDSFLEKISIGAIGTRRVFDDLVSQGHTPIELERGSMSFKIWKGIKIKRIRVPDILCTACAKRLESRAKTTLEVSMSHSFAHEDRCWDYVLNDNDFVALVGCKRSGKKPVDWQADQLVQYISVADMRLTQVEKMVEYSDPKGAQEGFETRIIWPAKIATDAGIIISVTVDQVQYRRRGNNRIISLGLSKRITTLEGIKREITLNPLVIEGEEVVPNQILASVVPVIKKFPCSFTASTDRYIDQLSSFSHNERYTAVKALSVFSTPTVFNVLCEKIAQSNEDIYVRLEAAAGLARHGREEGWAFIKQCIEAPVLENRLEAVIILGEIQSDISCQLLSNVLRDSRQHADIRAGAAWSLGELRNRSALGVLVESFTAIDKNVRIEAARALAKLASVYKPEVLDSFAMGTEDKRPGIAWALSKSGYLSIDDILKVLVDEDARQWASFILGYQEPQQYIHEIERLKEQDAEVYFATTVLWKVINSWVYNLEVYG